MIGVCFIIVYPSLPQAQNHSSCGSLLLLKTTTNTILHLLSLPLSFPRHRQATHFSLPRQFSLGSCLRDESTLVNSPLPKPLPFVLSHRQQHHQLRLATSLAFLFSQVWWQPTEFVPSHIPFCLIACLSCPPCLKFQLVFLFSSSHSAYYVLSPASVILLLFLVTSWFLYLLSRGNISTQHKLFRTRQKWEQVCLSTLLVGEKRLEISCRCLFFF